MRMFFLVCAGMAVLATAPPGSAAISSISADFLTATYAFSGGTGTMTVADTADIVVEYTSGTQFTYTGGTWSLSSTMVNDLSVGGKADGDFSGGQILLKQGATDLLTADLIGMTLTETRVTSNILAGTGTFQVKSGTLMGDFGTEGEIFMLEFKLSANVSSFQQNFTGLSDVTLTPVPEPATLAVLGLGGLLLRRRVA
jgi:hypothetical protein